MLVSSKPVVAVKAVRTGCGKSQVCECVCVCGGGGSDGIREGVWDSYGGGMGQLRRGYGTAARATVEVLGVKRFWCALRVAGGQSQGSARGGGGLRKAWSAASQWWPRPAEESPRCVLCLCLVRVGGGALRGRGACHAAARAIMLMNPPPGDTKLRLQQYQLVWRVPPCGESESLQ
jgi:hypothetical protein